MIEEQSGVPAPKWWLDGEAPTQESDVVEWELNYVLRMPQPPPALKALLHGLLIALLPDVNEPTWGELQSWSDQFAGWSKAGHSVVQTLQQMERFEGETLQRVAPLVQNLDPLDFDRRMVGVGARCAPWLCHTLRMLCNLC